MDKHDMMLTYLCVYMRKCKQKVAGQLGDVVELLLFAICHKCDSKLRLKITDSRSPVMMTGQIFFSSDKPRFWPVKLMNIIITLLPMEYRITLAVRHCRSSFCRQVGEKFIHTLLSSFPRFSPVLCPFIYTFSIIVRRCRKSPRFVLYLHIGET